MLEYQSSVAVQDSTPKGGGLKQSNSHNHVVSLPITARWEWLTGGTVWGSLWWSWEMRLTPASPRRARRSTGSLTRPRICWLHGRPSPCPGSSTI